MAFNEVLEGDRRFRIVLTAKERDFLEHVDMRSDAIDFNFQIIYHSKVEFQC